MEEFITWEVLGTYAGATAMTALIVQFLKSIFDKYTKIPTQVISYFIALIILLIVQEFTTGLNASTAALTVFNALIVCTASNGVYDGIKRIKGKVSK